MKRLLFLVLTTLFIDGHAQVYNVKIVFDRFQDMKSSKHIKTIINESDSIITFEEKRKAPIEYFILQYSEEGTKDEPFEYDYGQFAYDKDWLVVEKPHLSEVMKIYCAYKFEEITKEEFDQRCAHYLSQITHRFVVTEHTHNLIKEVWIVSKYGDECKTLYGRL